LLPPLPRVKIRDVPGFLSRLLSKSSPPAASAQTFTASLYTGDETLEVVGESHYQDALWRIVGGRRADPVRYETHAVLMPEPDNQYDANAVKVLVEGELVGYLSREDAAVYHPGLLGLMATSTNRLVALDGVIVGGGPRPDGIGFLGVFLDHDPADFGLASHHVSNGRGIRTGFSAAVATDLEDDSYDLSWSEKLSENDVTAITQLRALLEAEREPIDRHYMFCELERRLYKSRAAFASALDEFDVVCLQHDGEMVTIRPALLDKFGGIPVVDMYRQAAVRCQKTKNWQAALEWAERGLALYGADAVRPEIVEDLHKRIAHATAKIDEAERPRPRKPRAATVATSTAAPEIETLVCESCGMTFERARTRGRKPHACPTCRGLPSPTLST
jgi:hypothetical protein